MTQSRTKNINYMEETMIIKFSCSKECTVTNSNLMHKRYQEVYSRQLLFLSISCLSFPHLIFYVSFMIGFMRHNICSSPFSVYAYHSSFWKLQLFNLLDQTTAKSSAVIYLKDYNDITWNVSMYSICLLELIIFLQYSFNSRFLGK